MAGDQLIYVPDPRPSAAPTIVVPDPNAQQLPSWVAKPGNYYAGPKTAPPPKPVGPGLKDVEIGLRQGAADLVGMLARPSDALYGARLPSGRTLAEVMEDPLRPNPEDVAARQSFASKAIQFGARLPVDAARYGLATVAAGGNPVLGMAGADALTAANTTPQEALRSGVTSAALAGLGTTLLKGARTLAPELRTATPPGGLAIPKTAAPPVLGSEAGFLKLPNFDYQKFRTRWVDEFSPLYDLEQMGNVPPTQSAYNSARLFAGHFGKIVDKERELRRILRPVAADNLTPDLDKFLELERHKELFARPDLADMYQTPGNMTAQQVDAELANMRSRLGPDAMAKVENAANQTRMWSDNLLREYADSGMISQDAYQAILDANHHYAPLQRTAYLADEADKLPIGGRTFNVRQQPIVKEIKGSTQEVLPATEAFLRNAYRMTTMAERNKVNSRLAAMADMPEFKDVVRPLRGDMAPGPNEGAISTFIDGQKQAFAVPKPVADAVSGMNVRDADMLEKWIGSTNKALVEGSTRFYLPFIAKNSLRDFQTATLRGSELGGTGFTPIDWLKGMWSAINRDQWYDTYLRSGASFSGFFERQGTVAKSLERITEPEWKRVARRLTPWGIMRIGAETSELGPRIGYMRKALDRGFSLDEAGLLTRGATVDFARTGTAMKHLNAWIPFINARTQGTLLTADAIRKNPVRSAAILSATIGMPDLYSYTHNVSQFPQVWADIPEYEKWNNFLYIYGDKKDDKGNYTQVVKLPKGDVGRYFSNPLEWSLDKYRNDDPRGFAELATQLGSDLSPIDFAREGHLSGYALASSATPPGVKAAVIEPLANKNLYTGRAIETDEMKKIAPKARRTVDTPEWLVKATQALPDFLQLSPVMAQNFITTQFGGVGRLAAGDVKPDKNSAEERTGWGPMKRAFLGARGGGLEEKQFHRDEPTAQQAATEDYESKLRAERMYINAMGLPASGRLQFLRDQAKSGQLDLTTLKHFLDNVQVGAKGMTPYERWFNALPIETKGRVMADELQRLPDAASRVKFLKRFADIGAVSDDVAGKIAEYYGKSKSAGRSSNLSPLEQAFGIQEQLPLPPKETSPLEKAFGIK